MTHTPNEKQAVVLSGGGAYGAYEVGVMKALFQGHAAFNGYQAIDPEVFTGTSVGAFNAAAMTMEPRQHSAPTINQLEDFWLNDVADNDQTCGNGVFRFRGNPTRYLEPACFSRNPFAPFLDLGGDFAFYTQSLLRRGANLFSTSGSVPTRLLHFVDISALISIAPFKEMLRKTIVLEDIRRSDKLLRIVATNFDTGNIEIFENKHMTDEHGHEVIQASAAIPGIFPSVKIGGDTYVDGGVIMNTPLKCALQAGATMLYVIYLDPDVGNIPMHRMMNTLDTIDRVFTISLATKINEDIDTAAWINEGLAVIEKLSKGATATDADMMAFIRVASQIEMGLRSGSPFVPLTIHRFHPHDDLGGTLGMLDFRREPIMNLIDRGYTDTVSHDCSISHCIFHETPPPPEKVRQAYEG